jgi:AcrR family transcriptional regulator
VAAVAKRAGLSRSSVYGYFSSRDDLVVAVCVDAVATRCDTIIRSMTAQADPEGQLREYVAAQLRAAGDARHRLAMQLLQAGVSAEGLERIREAHAPLRAALLDTLSRMQLAEPERAAALVQAAITAAYEQIQAGSTPTPVIRDTIRFVSAGLRDLDRTG